jgi:hypothetical protein
MKHKVKKFGRGGDIITGIGAALLGKALYDKYKGSKDQDSDSGIGLKKPKISEEVDKAQESSRKKPETSIQDTDERIRANKASKGQPEMGDATNDGIVTKKTKPGGGVNKSRPAAQSTTSSSPSSQGVIDAGKQQKSVVENKPKNPALNRAGLSGKGITMPGDPNAKGSRQKGRSANPIQETIDNAGKSVARTPQQKMSEGAREVQRRREEAEKSRYKKGGSVSSASKRADGIAIRGKTRA